MGQKTPEKILHFDIIEMIGEGKNGTVYQAQDTDLQQVVALRLLDPGEDHDRDLMRKRKTALENVQRLEHPSICALYGVEEYEDALLIVMEYLEGQTVREAIQTGPMTPTNFLDVAIPVTEGLTYAHELNVTHGNIQPSNIMLCSDGQVKILDFGLPRGRGASADQILDLPLETLSYISPEQVHNEPVGQLADLFSLGVVFYEMLTCRLPFSGADQETLARSIWNHRPDFRLLRKMGVPGEIVLLVERLLAKSKTERCAGANELLITLEAISSFEKKQAMDTSEGGKRRSPRLYLLISLLAVLLVLVWIIATTYR